MAKSTKRKRPAKPYPDFPLTAHPSGLWCKKIRGKLYYFGPWADPDAALQRYETDRDDLYAGRPRRSRTDGITIAELCNRFLAAKKVKVESSELSQLTWNDYFRVSQLLTEVFGRDHQVESLCSDDFAKLRAVIAKRGNLVTQSHSAIAGSTCIARKRRNAA